MSDEITPNTPVEVGDLKLGAKIKGTVKNIELFGAFVSIGGGRDALLHISQLGKPVRNVEDVLKVGDEITAYVIRIDEKTGRVALSLVKPPAVPWAALQIGQSFTGTVTRIERFGVFVDIGAERPGMVHVSELADGFVKSPEDVVSVGQQVEVRIIKVNRGKRQIDMSMKEETPSVAEVMDDANEEVPTAMALAFRRAMSQQDDVEETPARKRARGEKSPRNEQDDIISRTLRHHSS